MNRMEQVEQYMKKGIVILMVLALLTGCQSRNATPAQTPPDQERSDIEAESGIEEDSSELEFLEQEASESGEESEAESSLRENGPKDLSEILKEEHGGADHSPSGEQTPGSEEGSLEEEQEEEMPPEKEAPGKAVMPENGDWSLILVNYNHAIDEKYAPEMEEVPGGYSMDARVAGVMKQMISDAKDQGISLMVCSAYRPYSSQQRNFNNSVAQYVAAGYSQKDAETETLRLIAAPGTSEHQTGLSADIVTPTYQGLDDGYANTAAAKWLKANAAEYGFILRYPKDKTAYTKIDFEPWHYRYVGVDAAREIMSQGLCLEEYLGEA